MTHRFVRLALLAFSAALGVSLHSGASWGQTGVMASPVYGAADVQAYWSPDRMLEAKPMPLPQLAGSPLAGSESQAAVTGSMFLVTSAEAGETSSRLVGSAAETAIAQAAGGPTPQFHPGDFAYTRYRLFPNTEMVYRRFPYSAMGQLFFTIPGRGDFICSGSSVSSANKSVVWTAGHCVFSPGIGFHNNFLFVPARHEGLAPFGLFSATQAFTTTQWGNVGAFEFDHGALVMARGGADNRKIADVVGSLGFLANASRHQHWNLDGWPAAPRNLSQTPPGRQFDGTHHEICEAAFATTDDPSRNGAALATAVGCDQTGGTSGGPWIVDFNGLSGATNFLNGNNSYRYGGPNPPENLKLFSPHFANEAVNLLQAAESVRVP